MGWIAVRIAARGCGVAFAEFSPFSLRTIEAALPAAGDLPSLERGDLRQNVEVPIQVQHLQVVADRAGGNHAICTRPDCQSGSPRRAVKIDGLEQDVATERRFDDRKGTSCTTGRQVTTSSKSTNDSRWRLVDFLNTSIQTDVFNENHGGASCNPFVLAHNR